MSPLFGLVQGLILTYSVSSNAHFVPITDVNPRILGI